MITNYVSEEFLKFSSKLFNGDLNHDLFSYKSGPKIFYFFNKYFGFNDHYSFANTYPSRWQITEGKLIELINKNQFDKFLTIATSISYLHSEFVELNNDELAIKQNKILKLLNEKLEIDGFKVICFHDSAKLVLINDDEIFLGEGGFAICYYMKSKKIVEKRLKEECYLDQGIVSRFKREFNLTKSLSDISGVIKVYNYNQEKLSYSMEYAECDLYHYILNNRLDDEHKFLIIFQLFDTMKAVHSRDIIHRDLSPNNILLFSGLFKISDFGLGKNLDIFYSHQTLRTNSCGQYYYCDPKQFMKLKEGNKLSDIYSLGKIINFILTDDPTNTDHMFRSVVEKATNETDAFRYQSVEELENAFKQRLTIVKDKNEEKNIEEKITKGVIDESVADYVNSMSSETMYRRLQNHNFLSFYERFIISSYETEHHVQEKLSDLYDFVNQSYKSFIELDCLGWIAIYILLNNKLGYVTKELAINLLNIPLDANRFAIVNEVSNKIISNIEPSLEELIHKENIQ